jgi:hypothetical protein
VTEVSGTVFLLVAVLVYLLGAWAIREARYG